MQNKILTVLCFDSNYAPYAAVTTYSLQQNSDSALNIVWLVAEADRDHARALQISLQKQDIAINLISVDESRFSQWKETNHISRGPI